MIGRPPKSPDVKAAAGNPGKRPLNNEPEPPKGRPVMPRYLSKAAQKEWRRIVPQLLDMGVLTVVDGPILAIYCESVAEWEKANAELERDGLTYRREDGVIKDHPAIKIRNNAWTRMQKVAQEFGLTPASRARLHVEKKKPTQNKLQQLLSRRKHSHPDVSSAPPADSDQAVE